MRTVMSLHACASSSAAAAVERVVFSCSRAWRARRADVCRGSPEAQGSHSLNMKMPTLSDGEDKYFCSDLYILCPCVYVHACQGICVEVREQLVEVISLFLTWLPGIELRS